MLFVAWLYHQIFYCCRRVDAFLFSPNKKDETVSASSFPWLWIGAEGSDGEDIDVTNEVNDAVRYGVTIDPSWLCDLTGLNDVEWKYLDSKTLDKLSFPPSGFVIDDPVESDPEDSTDE